LAFLLSVVVRAQVNGPAMGREESIPHAIWNDCFFAQRGRWRYPRNQPTTNLHRLALERFVSLRSFAWGCITRKYWKEAVID
jgi:hypothetical protein